MRRPFEYLFTWIGLAYLGVLLILAGTGLWLACLVIPRARRRAFAQASIARLFRLYLGTLSRLGWLKLDLSQLESLKSAGPMVVAPNHPSLLDAVMLLAHMPKAVCLMKHALMMNPLYGFGARTAGYVSNLSSVSIVRRVREARDLGEQVLVFPEGTRTVTAPVNPVTGLFAVIAKCTDLPVQVVFIESDSEFLGKHWPLWKAPNLPVRYRAVLGPVLSPSGAVRDLAAQVQDIYETHFDAASFVPFVARDSQSNPAAHIVPDQAP